MTDIPPTATATAGAGSTGTEERSGYQGKNYNPNHRYNRTNNNRTNCPSRKRRNYRPNQTCNHSPSKRTFHQGNDRSHLQQSQSQLRNPHFSKTIMRRRRRHCLVHQALRQDHQERTNHHHWRTQYQQRPMDHPSRTERKANSSLPAKIAHQQSTQSQQLLLTAAFLTMSLFKCPMVGLNEQENV